MADDDAGDDVGMNTGGSVLYPTATMFAWIASSVAFVVTPARRSEERRVRDARSIILSYGILAVDFSPVGSHRS